MGEGRTAGPSTSLRSGRDDNSNGDDVGRRFVRENGAQQVPTSLRSGRDDKSNGDGAGRRLVREKGAQQVPPLRYAPDDKGREVGGDDLFRYPERNYRAWFHSVTRCGSLIQYCSGRINRLFGGHLSAWRFRRST